MTAILATEATLQTLQVEIKALTVKGKQMTLAVFRQLPQTQAYGVDAAMRQGASYWGRVNYKIKDEDDAWFVMEMDDILYRCPGSAPFSVDHENDLAESVQWIRDSAAQVKAAAAKVGTDRPTMVYGSENYQEQLEAAENFGAVWDAAERELYYDKDYNHKYNTGQWLVVASRKEAEHRRVVSMMETWNSLMKLPQLFISV